MAPRLPLANKDDPAEDFLRWSIRTKRVSSSILRSPFTRDFIIPFFTCIVLVLILALGLWWYRTVWPKVLQNEVFKNVILVENMEVKSLLTRCSRYENAICFVGEATLLIKSESPFAVAFDGLSGYLTLTEPLTPLVRDTMAGLMSIKYKLTSTAFSTARFKVPFVLEMFDDGLYMGIVRNGTNPALYFFFRPVFWEKASLKPIGRFVFRDTLCLTQTYRVQ
ncbi:hypothetical protein FOL47_006377 [Perkinsus chesapeaki]|uniref:Uncharacterized protein n=1 Tax=Perkinsus chesapeaki TaxID=330153 RepID=A0A7J6LSR3_PERCH|nr:hypothetical protein FOL47_006377 [Perkinsus chesapeaki]